MADTINGSLRGFGGRSYDELRQGTIYYDHAHPGDPTPPRDAVVGPWRLFRLINRYEGRWGRYYLDDDGREQLALGPLVSMTGYWWEPGPRPGRSILPSDGGTLADLTDSVVVERAKRVAIAAARRDLTHA